VLLISSSALFRRASGADVFGVERGRAALREVTVGRDDRLHVQVLDGLEEGEAEGEAIIIHPGHSLEDGRRVRSQAGHVVW